MAFVQDSNAVLSKVELANRDATYMLVRFVSETTRISSTFGLSTSGNGRHAEAHFVYWCGKNRKIVEQWFQSEGHILELLLTKSPYLACTKLLIEFARGLNSPGIGLLSRMWITMVGMHKGVADPSSQASLQRLHMEQPLIRLFTWSPHTADTFDATDRFLLNNWVHFDRNAPPSRQGTDVEKRVKGLEGYLKTSLGYSYTDRWRTI